MSETTNKLQILKKSTVDVVQKRVMALTDAGELQLPENYSVGNAIAAWWLVLQKTQTKDKRPVLQACTQDSIANATLDMVVQGLNPSRDQCYPVAYGNTLVCLRSYFGDEALLRRIFPGADVFAEVIYKDDTIEYEIVRGRKMVTKHQQSFGNIGDMDKIAGAYAIADLGDDAEPHCEIMTLDQIQAAWARGENWPPKNVERSAHHQHPEEFTRKTVIARLCKRLINSADDSYLAKAARRQSELAADAEMEAEMEEALKGEIIDLPPAELPEASEGRPGSAAFLKMAKELDLDPAGLQYAVRVVTEADPDDELTEEHYAAAMAMVDEGGPDVLLDYLPDTDRRPGF